MRLLKAIFGLLLVVFITYKAILACPICKYDTNTVIPGHILRYLETLQAQGFVASADYPDLEAIKPLNF